MTALLLLLSMEASASELTLRWDAPVGMGKGDQKTGKAGRDGS